MMQWMCRLSRRRGRNYGNFAGVFTKTPLTILGVIMYLRQGSVVGNAGLCGAWIIIGLVCAIIACTALPHVLHHHHHRHRGQGRLLRHLPVAGPGSVAFAIQYLILAALLGATSSSGT